MKISKSTRLQLQINKAIFILLVFLIAGLLGWLSNKNSIQFDWTANKRNTLSQSSIDLLKTMQDPVLVNVYVQDVDAVKTAVEEILNRYQRAKEDFKYKIINPDLDIDMARQDSITRYGQIIIKYKGRFQTVTSLSEQEITGALLRLSRDNNPNLVYLSGHGERDPVSNENTAYNKFTDQLSDKGISVTTKNLLKSELGIDTSVLVIAAPSHPVLEGELEHIKNYISNGGNLLWMMDPGNLQGLDELASFLDITFQKGVIVDNNTNLRNTLGIQHPAVIPVLDYFQHAITKNINYNTLFPISRGVTGNDNSPWKTSIIAQSLPKSWSETDGLKSEIIFDSDSGDIAGPISIILALEKILGDSSQANSVPGKTQRIVVAGDSDFLSNSYIGVGANLQLGLNIINWLTEDDTLIAIEPKPSNDTQLRLSDTATLLIGSGFLVILPIFLLTSGLIIWFKRRRR